MTWLRALATAVLVMSLFGAPAVSAAPRVVAVGDLHGDYAAWMDIAQAAKVADAKGHWTGGDTVLVQLGDVPDRGPDTLKIIHSLQALEKEAAEAGGKVIPLVGNHEAMNVTGDLRYVSAGEYAAFETSRSKKLRDQIYVHNQPSILAFYRRMDPDLSEENAKRKWLADFPLGKGEHRVAWSPSGDVGKWVIGHPAIVRIARTLFVHGGISLETAAHPIADVNEAVHSELAKGESDAPSILTDPLGPLWYRGNVQREEPAADAGSSGDGTPPAAGRPSISDELGQVLAAYDADRLVVAHTPNLAGIVASENGRLVRVDTGISSAYGGARSWLEIRDGQALAHRKEADGSWSSTALPSPGGAGE